MRAPRIDPVRLRAWRAFLEAHNEVIRRLEQELETERGVPLNWYDVLLHLNGAPGRRLRMHELASAVLLSRSGLTRLVDRMEAAGMVRRESHPHDGRGTVAALTPEGRATLRRCAPIHLRGVQEHFLDHLGPDEAATLAAALSRVAEAVRQRTGIDRHGGSSVA